MSNRLVVSKEEFCQGFLWFLHWKKEYYRVADQCLEIQKKETWTFYLNYNKHPLTLKRCGAQVQLTGL